MPSNGCGMTGLLSKSWKLATGTLPPFEACCDEHDLAYEQVETLEDKAWADDHLRRCMAASGYPALGVVFQAAVRSFGWLAIFKERSLRWLVSLKTRLLQ